MIKLNTKIIKSAFGEYYKIVDYLSLFGLILLDVREREEKYLNYVDAYYETLPKK